MPTDIVAGAPADLPVGQWVFLTAWYDGEKTTWYVNGARA